MQQREDRRPNLRPGWSGRGCDFEVAGAWDEDQARAIACSSRLGDISLCDGLRNEILVVAQHQNLSDTQRQPLDGGGGPRVVRYVVGVATSTFMITGREHSFS